MRLRFKTDEGWGGRATLGLIVLQADETIEPELRAYTARNGVVLYHSRIPSGLDVTPESLAQMEAEIPGSVGLLPAHLGFDVIGYGCTSGATIIGAKNVARAIHSVKPAAATTDPLTAVKAALEALGAKKIGFVTPYIADVSAAMRQNLEASGFEVAGFGSFEQSEERKVARIDAGSVRRAILDVGAEAPCDAVFISCTNLRTQELIADTEATLSKPVIASNQVLAWHMLRLAEIHDTPTGFGRLFGCPL